MKIDAIRGPTLSFKGDPFLVGDIDSIYYEPDGLILIEDEKVKLIGDYSLLKNKIPDGIQTTEYKNSLIIPGFIDTHTHYAQTQIMGSYGKQLIDWLNNYTFKAEEDFIHFTHAQMAAKFFVKESLKAGTTTSVVYGTVHSHSADTIFLEALNINMRMIAGKVMMDRNAPSNLLDTAQKSYDESLMLIDKWHGKKRLSYAVTPRFAPTSTEEQLELAGTLCKKFPDVYLQTHLSENKDEIIWAKNLFPKRKGYLDIYDHFGLVGKKSIFGHGIYLTDEEWDLINAKKASIAHCPTSNEFLGSGLFPFEKAKNKRRQVRLGLATDIGAGTSFSQLQSMNEAYKIAQLQGFSLSSARAFFLATRGAAESLDLDDKIGSIKEGMEADLLVLDLKATPLIDFRMKYVKDIQEILFVLMTLGDDRATKAVYVAGKKVYEK